jgi:integrase
MDKIKKIKTHVSGLQIKNGSYFLRKMIHGKHYQLSLGRADDGLMTLEEAEDKAVSIMRKIKTDGYDAYKALQASSVSTRGKSNAPTLLDIIEEFLEHARSFGTRKTKNKPLRSESISNYKKQYKRWSNLLNLPITSIDKDLIKQEYFRWLQMTNHEGKPAITSSYDAIRHLSRIFNWAIGKEHILNNPCDSLMKSESLVKPTARRTDSEVRYTIADGTLGRFIGGLLDYKPKQAKRSYITTRDAIIFGLMTGARKKEIFNLEWDWFNNTSEFAYFETPAEVKSETFDGTKSRVPYYYPCSILVQDMLKARYKNRHQLCADLGGHAPLKYVFPNRLGNGPITKTSSTLKSILNHCGISHRKMHDFRKTFEDICEQPITEGKLKGTTFPDRIIKRAIHHSSSDITFSLYAISAPDKVQLHRIYQHVENFCSMSLGGGTLVDVFGEETTYSATVRIATDNETEIDERVSSKDELRLALYNEEYDYQHPVPIGEFAQQEAKKIKERLGLDEDVEFEKWRKDKTASNDLSDWDTRWSKMLNEALEKYKNNKN